MAEGLIRDRHGSGVEVHSAGTHPTAVRPEAVAVMREIGIDISGHRSKSVEAFAGQAFDDVLTVCHAASESCPVFAGPARRLHRDFDDPAAIDGGEAERLAAFRRVRDALRAWLSDVLTD
jgi:arsenate reductase